MVRGRHDVQSFKFRTGSAAGWIRWLLLVVLLLLGLAAIVYFSVERLCNSSDRQRFLDLRGEFLHSEESVIETTDDDKILKVILEDSRELQVIGHLKAPAPPTGRHPAFLLLGGVRTGRHSIDYIPPTQGVVLFALDYPYEGKKSGLSVWEFVTALPAMRRGIIRTVPAAMLAIDYLLNRPDVDPDRIVLISGSVGALFAPAIAATDTRIAALVLLFGGGDIQSLLARIAEEDLGWFTRPGAWLGNALTCPVEPLHYIGDVSPRPVFMLNGTEDLGIPEHNTLLLFEAAREPKTLRWIEAGHVVLSDESFHKQVTQELVNWLIEQELVRPSSFVGSSIVE